jgi:branched-chain amino acid transport system substrate-binding protein
MTLNRKSTPALPTRRKIIQSAGAAAGLSAIGLPAISFADDKPIKIGMPTILSGRVATLGISSRNAVMMEIEKFNAAGGFGGRKIEVIVRDSKGAPQESARIARELVNSEGCELLIDGEASTGSFAVQEVARDLGVFCIHTCSETSSLSADPKLRSPYSFRCARQGIHDAIIGGSYAATVAKEKGLKRWMTISPDYAYGRDTTAEFMEYLKHFNKDIEVIGEVWPKIFQPDYTESITRLQQGKPQAVYSALWGGDLSSFIDQASIYALFKDMPFFAVSMADYTVLTAIKAVPPNLYSCNRYLKSFPNTAANTAWGDAYFAKFKEYPTNWAWQNAAAVSFITTAMKKTNSIDSKKLSEALRGMTIDSPFGANGKITMRAEDQTIVEYADGWGALINKEPYMPTPQAGDWKVVYEIEAEWKKRKGYL